MKTWRERIMEARERGSFTKEDFDLWSRLHTCPAGVVAIEYGLISGVLISGFMSCPLPARLYDLGNKFGTAMDRNYFNKAEQLLDEIEETALELKRKR